MAEKQQLEGLVCGLATCSRVLPLRHAVLRKGLPRDAAMYEEDNDPSTLHFAAALKDEVIGCCTLLRSTWNGTPAFQLRGMATHPAWMGKGVGSTLLAHVEATLLSLWSPPVMLWCNARLSARPFYLRQGWQVKSDVFDVPNVGPHHVLIKELR